MVGTVASGQIAEYVGRKEEFKTTFVTCFFSTKFEMLELIVCFCDKKKKN